MSSSKLKDQAATAALYVTKDKGDKSDKSTKYPLDVDGKLSSAGAATSLKHASPKDLPAFPVVGLPNADFSAGAAATLANKNQKSFEHWKPGEIPAANKAALRAKDYKADPLWQPELSAAGSKAALHAAKDGGNVNIWRPQSTDAGHSAAGQAMRMTGLSPKIDYGHTEDGGKRALVAATGAMSGSRKRSGSTPNPPISYPDAGNSSANALKAATSANRPLRARPAPAAPSQPVINAGRIHNQAITNLSREMYTSHPPVAPEVEEKNKQAGLRAAAVSMAKQMYDLQQKQIEEAAALPRSDSQYAASTVTERPLSSAPSRETAPPPQYANLQEAARKLAAERLAKLHDQHAAYRNYYGTQLPHHRKISIRGRKRASSDGHIADSDEERSKQIRDQMSLFTDTLAQVDSKKRQKDRESLMAAAQRNVRASMTAQDERVFNETGKVSPAMMAEWEAKAKAKAEADSEARLVNHGMVNIGGGRYLDQSEVDAIAAAKVQPTLDEITEAAERQRARDEQLRQEQLERERIAAEKAADDKERSARTKEEWRRFREEEKREEKVRKEEAKAKKAEEKRLRDEEKRKSRDQKAVHKPSTEPVTGESGKDTAAAVEEPTAPANMRTQAGEERRFSPESIPPSEMEPITAEGAVLVPTSTEESMIQPMVTADTGEVPVTSVTSADKIPRRVFAAPVDHNTENLTTDTNDSPTREIRDLANATSNTQVAPVVGAKETSAPETEVRAANASNVTGTTAQPQTISKLEPASAAHITSSAGPAAATDTTVSGPAAPKSPKEKEAGKVSTWLKTKFSRRAIKPSNTSSDATHLTISEPRDPKVFVGGANLGAPDVTTTSPDREDSSMREVAMAGKEAGSVDAPVVSPTSPDKTSATGLPHEPASSSTSISLVSSDEDTRGRSALRLADTIPGNQGSQPIFGATAATSDRPAAVANDSMPLDPALPHSGGRQRSSSVGGTTGTDEFEEARDNFDSDMLVPPDKGVVGGEGRKSDSPARDSRFIEVL
ncbi:MAG: hypothetical protein Q9163_005995 [Psora crenata]